MATVSCIWLSNANSNAIAITDLGVPLVGLRLVENVVVGPPISSAEAKSSVGLGLEPS